VTSYIYPWPGPLPIAIPAVEHILATRGTAGYRQYRIPALAVTAHGTVLAAYDGRPNLDDLPSPIDLLLRRSTDSGHTWSSQKVVRTGKGLEGFGDPSLLVDMETQRVFLFHAAGTRAGFFEATAGQDPDDEYVQHCDLSFSDDDGLTWQHRRITSQLKSSTDRPVTGIFAAAGQGIQIHSGPFTGRLVQQFVILCEGTIMAASAYSDDHGDSWVLGQLVGEHTHGFSPNENKLVALAGGRLLLHSRSTPRRLAATSHDGGATWSALVPVEELPDPSDNGSLVRFDGLPHVAGLAGGSTDSWLLATNNHDAALRRNTVLSLSPDDGLTWPAKLVLCTGSSAYSTATRLPDGNIGVLYERQGYREIVFTSVPAEPLTQQLAAPPETSSGDGPGLEFDIELRSITPGRPARWLNAGEFHVMPSNTEGWNVHTWKEIGQGYTEESAQIIGTREAQDLNYGHITPGYKAGDILAFTGRARNGGTLPVTQVRLDGPGANAFPAEDLLPGAEALYFTPTHTVTEEEVKRGSVEVSYTVEGVVGGSRCRTSRTFHFDTATGAVREEHMPWR
jgi:sialidase-1